MKFNLKFLFITLFICTISVAQNKGTISGVLTDKETNNEVLPFANVLVKGTNTSANTDIDGKYSLSVNPGNYIIIFSFVGYESVEKPVTVKANETITVNQVLSSGSFTLKDVVVKAAAVSKQKETALLLEQKNAVDIKQTIGAQELSRKGVGDVAAAVAKTSGVSKQEGSNNVFVRGLGDRYNSTSMNGLPIPSNDPERKNIALDLFSTDIVEYISIDKSYGSRMYGDFAGGNVDIVSKDYRGKGMFEISLGSKVNTNALQNSDNFLLQQGPNKSGFVSYGVPQNALTGYNFENSLNPKKESPFGGNFNVKAGKTFNIGEEGKLSLFATASFNNGYEYREGLSQSVNAQGASLKSFQQEKYTYNTNSTGMFNANYRLNKNHKIGYNFLFINSSEQTRDTYFGTDRDFDNADASLLVQRGTFSQNTVFINQLLGNHKITDKIDFDWGVSYNTVKGDMPDRTQNKMFYNPTTDIYTIAQRTTTDNQRYYQNLKEDEAAANLAFTYKLGDKESGTSHGKIVVGYNGKFKKRDFEAIQFNFNVSQAGLATSVTPNNLDAFFNQTNYDNGIFSIGAFAGMTPQTYSGDQDIHAGFANIEYKLTDKLSGVLGFRYEKISQSVTWRTQLDASGGKNEFDRNEFLPSLALKYALSEKQNLRLAASKTYTLPQFKERALFIYEDVMETKIGNPDLYPSQNYNLDLKWEMFPKSDELFSVTAFGKYILDPINEVVIASASNDISWVNIGDSGYAYGLELEARKNIFEIEGEYTNKLSFGFNASLMQTHQDIDSQKVQKETNSRMNINLTDTSSGFTGASDLILNADLSYTKNWKNDSGIMATIAYNHYSDKLYAIGSEQKGNLVDKAMGTLDLVLKTKLNKSFGIDFGARNLLNPQFKRVQENSGGDVLVFNYKKGVTFGLGMNYQF
ncbi:TonB-dependent receptor [Flavobacterium aquidurense]|uniref:TonB-dependent receptor n=1 Tax=Flavobacterium aquidurense TaxID=362413 RepID=UPI00091893E9|nr:TonB-dependent receptor [Flavobacterium aquidurense]OXA71874.1 TonB-dependent receptor [Flavobacterium aquidurense]SHH53800.1 Outer membrane receptor proteins, mostly Fe transport [Flavobacterium frigidimaris]